MANVQHSERAHALLSASGSSRWMNCTPSARLEDKIPSTKKSVYADEGTLAHEYGELGLRKLHGSIAPAKYKKEIALLEKRIAQKEAEYGVTFNKQEMQEEAQKYIDYVWESYLVAKKKTPGAILSIEDRTDLTEYVPEAFGTCDANIIADGVLKINDLKYGKGVQVNAEENTQLMLYGLGALVLYDLDFDIHTIELTIVQPRLNHISVWSISRENLLSWGEEVKKLAKKAFAGEGVQKAGDWCRWCKLKPTCRALSDKALETAKLEFAEPKTLDMDELIEAHETAALLLDWHNSVKEYLFKQALAGKSIPGHKLVAGRSSRKWVDDSKVKAALIEAGVDESKYTTVKLAGITAVEKLLGKTNFQKVLGELTVKPEGAPTLVKNTDKRPEYKLTTEAEDDFSDDLENEIG